MKMGERIYNLRMKNNMTLEELGNKIGVGKSTVRKWEKGLIANMKRDKIAKIAHALGVSPAYLMGWTDDHKDNELFPQNQDEELAMFFGSVLSANRNTFQKRLILSLSKLSDEQWNLLENIALSLFDEQENTKK